MKFFIYVIMILLFFSSFLKSEESDSNISRHNFSVYLGLSKGGFDPSFAQQEAFAVKELKSNTAEFSYLYSLAEKIRLGISFSLDAKEEKFTKYVEVSDTREFETLDIEEEGSINFQIEYDLYKTEKIAIFGFSELGLGFYTGDYEYTKANLQQSSDLSFWTRTEKYEAEYNSNVFNYGIGLGVHYNIAKNLRFTNKIGYSGRPSASLSATAEMDDDDVVIAPVPSNISAPEVNLKYKGNIRYLIGLTYFF